MSGLCLGRRILTEIEPCFVFAASERAEVMAKLPPRVAGLRGRNTDQFG